MNALSNVPVEVNMRKWSTLVGRATMIKLSGFVWLSEMPPLWSQESMHCAATTPMSTHACKIARYYPVTVSCFISAHIKGVVRYSSTSILGSVSVENIWFYWASSLRTKRLVFSENAIHFCNSVPARGVSACEEWGTYYLVFFKGDMNRIVLTQCQSIEEWNFYGTAFPFFVHEISVFNLSARISHSLKCLNQ